MSWAVRLSRWVLGAESLGTGCLGTVALLLAVATLFDLPQALPATLSLTGIALALLGGAALLAWLLRRLSQTIDRWTLIAAALEVALIPIGIALMSIPTPQSNSIIDEGGHGFTALLGFAYAFGGTTVAILSALRAAGDNRPGPPAP